MTDASGKKDPSAEESEKGFRVNDRRVGSQADEESSQASAEHDAEGFPPIDFMTFVLSLSTSCLLHLGDAGESQETARHKNLPMAKQTIDLLGVLEEKTRGNLSGEEERLLTQVLYDLRVRYVAKTKA